LVKEMRFRLRKTTTYLAERGDTSLKDGTDLEEHSAMARAAEVETRQHRRAPRLATTCRYCGGIYTYLSSEPRPVTCGNPQCSMRYT
jgi:hypothetical protein